MNWQELSALLVLATAMSFTPGPNTTLSAALAANGGLRLALPFVCAVPVGWCVLLVVCALGLGAFMVAIPALAWMLKLAGSAYLIWLAWRLAQSRPAGPTGHAQSLVGFWQGIGLQFVNAKAWMLALAIVSGWIAGRPDAVLRLGIVVPVLLIYAFASNLLYALVGSFLREWLSGPQPTGKRLLVFNRLMAAILVGTALWMLSL